MVSRPGAVLAAVIADAMLSNTVVLNTPVKESARPALNTGLAAVALGSTKNVAGTSRSSSRVTRGANRVAGLLARRPDFVNTPFSQDRDMVLPRWCRSL